MIRLLFFAILLFLVVKVNCSSILKEDAMGLSIKDTLERDTLEVDTVTVSRSVLNADSAFLLKQKDHRSIYLWGDNKKPISINPFGGILININKIFSHFSRIGKQSRRLQRVFKSELDEDLINEIWKPYTIKFTTLKGDSLFVFQNYFQPPYSWFSKASHYQKLEYIMYSLRAYNDSTEVIHEYYRLPKLDIK